MTLTEKEKQYARIIAILAVGAVAYFGWTWWDSTHDDLQKKYNDAVAKGEANDKTIKQGNAALKNFASRFSEVPEAQGQVSIAMPQVDPKIEPRNLEVAPTLAKLKEAFDKGGLVFTNWSSQTPSKAKNVDFREARFQTTTTTSTSRLAAFLQFIEAAKIPARIESMSITTPTPGQDNLEVKFVITVLLYAPPAGTKIAASGSSQTKPSAKPGAATTPALAPGATLSSAEEKAIEDKLAKARLDEANTIDNAPKRTAEEIAAEAAKMEADKVAAAAKAEADMLARRAQQEKALTTPSTTGTAPANNPGGMQ